LFTEPSRPQNSPERAQSNWSIPDNGKLSIKATHSTDGKVKEGEFDLGAVSEVRNKIAKACDWGAGGPVDEHVGSIDHEQKR
jgi:hypothetical protein